jgi:glyoxylase-like metal-dependent hydrolase (beta-lactamase superfamily II)
MVAGTGTILVDPKDGSMADYLTSLQRLLGLAPGLTLPAHGPVIHDGTHHLAATLAHRQERSAAVVQQVARGVQTPLAIARKVYVDVSWLALPLATRNVLSTLVHLEQQGRVRRDPRGRWRLA